MHFTPLGHEIAAPTGLIFHRFIDVAVDPRRLSATAALKPPMPAPITIASFFSFPML